MTFVYEDRDEEFYGLLQKDNLVKVYELEQLVVGDPQWSHLCLAESNDNITCAETANDSVLKIFDDVGAFKPHEIYRASQFTINQAFKKAMLNKTMWDDW